MNPPPTVPPPPRPRPAGPWGLGAALVVAALSAGCVGWRHIAEEDLPAAWRAEVAGTLGRPAQGRFASLGRMVVREGEPVSGRLEEMFFPGQFIRNRHADEIELLVGGDGACTARAWQGGKVAAELSLPGRINPRTGWVELDGLEVRNTNKFGNLMGTQSIRFGLGADGALYVRAHSYGAGLVLFIPAASSSVVWGRWEPAPR